MTRLALAMALAVTAVGRTSAQNFGDDLPTLAAWFYFYGSTSTTIIKPSDVFCGNCPKGRKCGEFSPPKQGCIAKAGKGLAREHVEIRGWVVDPGYYGDDNNEEYIFEVLLDRGWTPIIPTDVVHPISSPHEIAAAITPHNVIEFSRGIARLDGTAWGGSKSAVIKVEVDGWGPARMSHPLPVPPPNDWIRLPRDRLVGWPFDSQNPPSLPGGPLRDSAYVRLVGTLWEDTYHPNVGSVEEKKAKHCWARHATSYTPGDHPRYLLEERGWFEIHPVDFLAVLDSPAAHTDTLEAIAICGTGEVTRDIRPPGPRPSQTATVGFEEILDNAFIDWESVKTPNRVTVSSDGIRVHVRVEDLTSRAGASRVVRSGKFKAFYRVFWQ
jgi:hypothetical protein